jgi:ubiquinone/menaquinone biosynthesis C-methylase UbiE
MKNHFTLNMHDYIHQPEGKLFFNRQMFGHIASRYDFITRALSFGRDTAWKNRLVSDLPSFTAEHAETPCRDGAAEKNKKLNSANSAVSAVSAVSSYAPDCLDIACGTGDITFRLAAKYPDSKIVGIDVTEEMLDLARSRLRSSSVGCAARFGGVGCQSSFNTQPLDDRRYEPRNRNRFTQTSENIAFAIGDMCRMNFADNSFDIVTAGYALRNAPDLEQALIEIRRVMKPGATAAILDFSKSPNVYWQKIQDLLLRFWGGFWGILLHRNPQLYTYIAASLRQFPDSITLKQLIKNLGFTNIRSRKHFLGFTETILFQKP